MTTGGGQPGASEAATGDFLQLRAIDHLEFYVGNAKQAAYFYRWGFGFTPVAYAGLETGVRDRASYVLRQGEITLVLTAPLHPESPIAQHVRVHGDGVKDIALLVDDAERAYAETTRRGARGVRPPETVEDGHGKLKRATIATYGETTHTFVERDGYQGVFAPGYRPFDLPTEGAGLYGVDHVVGNVELGKMNVWVEFYQNVVGFSQLVHFDDEDISTEYSALMSKVMQNGEGRIKFPINEPAEGRRKSQIEEYLEYYLGPGVQHIAMLTDDICATVRSLEARGIEFLRAPRTYYEELPGRVGKIDERIDELAELGILADRDDEGYLLQIFSKPVQDRPTVFVEVIERKGSRGFGKGNFKALFEAIEREQAARGNL